MKDFAVFILSHGRPNDVITYKTLKKEGYTGAVFIIIDNKDKTADRYYKKFGDKVIMFDKQKIANKTDQGDNLNDLRTTTHVRNAMFEIANNIGVKYFIQLDDDYSGFRYRFINDTWLTNSIAKNGYGIGDLDGVFKILLDFYKKIPAKSIAIAQGGDYIGGAGSGMMTNYENLSRKCMNSFICSTDRPYMFFSRLNEDVNTYLSLGARGELFLTIPFMGLEQAPTQKTKGGMTDTYLDNGTYQKSFFSVMYNPSFIKVALMGVTVQRLHYTVKWLNAVPKIINENFKK